MANTPLKGIKILGLENTYTVTKNIEDGDGENNLLQSKDADSWSPSNSEVIRYIANEIGTADDGYKIQANEDGSVKVGAYGKFATSLNGKSQSLGKKSFTSGSKNIAFESNAHAEGNETFAAGKHSHAEGNTTAALGAASHAEGLNTKAGGDHSHAEGGATEAIGAHAHAEGMDAYAEGNSSHAEGIGTYAVHDCSHAEGEGTVTGCVNQHVQGRYNKADPDKAFILGNGAGPEEQNRKNAMTVDWYGNAWFAGSVSAAAIILTSPNGTKWQLVVDNDGTLKAEIFNSGS